MRRVHRIAVVVVGLLVALGSPVAAGSAAAASSHASTSTLTKAGLLRASDFPAGYTSSPHDKASDNEMQRTASKMKACKRLTAFMSAVQHTPKAESPDFTSGTATISNTVNVFPTVAKARAAVTSYASSGLIDCFGALLTKIAQQAGGSAQPDLGLNTGIGIGDQSVAFEGPVQITERDGSTSTLYFGNLAARFGRVVAVYSYSSEDDVSDVVTTATDASAQRIRTALG